MSKSNQQSVNRCVDSPRLAVKKLRYRPMQRPAHMSRAAAISRRGMTSGRSLAGRRGTGSKRTWNSRWYNPCWERSTSSRPRRTGRCKPTSYACSVSSTTGNLGRLEVERREGGGRGQRRAATNHCAEGSISVIRHDQVAVGHPLFDYDLKPGLKKMPIGIESQTNG